MPDIYGLQIGAGAPPAIVPSIIQTTTIQNSPRKDATLKPIKRKLKKSSQFAELFRNAMIDSSLMQKREQP